MERREWSERGERSAETEHGKERGRAGREARENERRGEENRAHRRENHRSRIWKKRPEAVRQTTDDAAVELAHHPLDDRVQRRAGLALRVEELDDRHRRVGRSERRAVRPDQAIGLGANQVNHIAFDVSRMETLMDEARRQAMDNARRRGELYAKAAGGELGPVLRISESGFDLQPVPRAAMRATATAPIEPGTRHLEVEVHVLYALR